ncbi:hypothetical protein [Aeoliella sp.]|uniref:hypothetical protein n=1 Tax=Aeoliella sp. TaxID=2795800 RepID=UPI003CCC2F63
MSKLTCPSCDYKSEAFGDAPDLYDGTYSFVFQDRDSHAISVVDIPGKIVEETVDLHAPGASARLCQAFSNGERRMIEIPLAVSDVEVDVICPECGNSRLVKTMVGLQ